MPQVKIGDLEVHYVGKGTNKDDVIVFVHGAGCNSDVWHHQLDFFSDDYHTVAVDLPGHASSSWMDECSMQGYVEVVKGLMDSLPTDRAILVGHSMGGGITLQFALTYPEMLRSMVLANTGARLRVLPQIFSLLRSDPDRAISMVKQFSFAPGTSEEIRFELERILRSTPVEVLIADLTACDSFDVMDQLGTIKTPALVICGEQDFMTPVKYSRYLSDNIEESTLEIINNAGHMSMMEQPDLFNSTLIGFVTAQT